MHVVVKNTKTIEEYKQTMQTMEEQAEAFYKVHKNACETWKHGEPVKVEKDNVGALCITYDSGTWFHYKLTPNGLEWF